jgi:hypothetical protein
MRRCRDTFFLPAFAKMYLISTYCLLGILSLTCLLEELYLISIFRWFEILLFNLLFRNLYLVSTYRLFKILSSTCFLRNLYLTPTFRPHRILSRFFRGQISTLHRQICISILYLPISRYKTCIFKAPWLQPPHHRGFPTTQKGTDHRKGMLTCRQHPFTLPHYQITYSIAVNSHATHPDPLCRPTTRPIHRVGSTVGSL